MKSWAKTKPTGIVVGLLDLSLLAFLIFDFGFKDFTSIYRYKLFVLPILLTALVGFNIYKLLLHRREKENDKESKMSLIILFLLIISEVINRKVNYINLMGRNVEKREVVGLPKPDMVFEEGDVLAVFGKDVDVKKYLKLSGDGSIN